MATQWYLVASSHGMPLLGKNPAGHPGGIKPVTASRNETRVTYGLYSTLENYVPKRFLLNLLSRLFKMVKKQILNSSHFARYNLFQVISILY